MTGVPHGRFTDYFKALNGYGPFQWQSELAKRFCDGRYPQALALPTAAGKTACIDIAVFAMAHQADWPAERRTAPRRIFFVVDRRIIVDAAFARAAAIAQNLKKADNGILREVADALRRVGGGHAPAADKSSDAVPLACFQLRGGIYRDDAWARTPTQPTVICSTVDQIGSRLLFRSYGNSPHCWPLHAGLAGNDALIILDEAHCAVPFMQTLEAVRRYREWADTPVRSPFHVVVMSATPPANLTDVYPARSEREDVLKDDLLRQRRRAAKPARLRIAAKPAKPRKGQPGLRHIKDNDLLVLDAADQALRWIDDGHDRVAIMVNRVMTAKRIFEALKEHNGDAGADVVLLTGRMRPIDRASLESAWTPRLRANSPEQLDRPVIVVTTQCLEVGADFSFDALVTECAAIDALRQRFGRLDRFGIGDKTEALILIRKEQVKPKEYDPIYGAALPNTWNWMNEHTEDHVIDMGIDALDALLPTEAEQRAALDAPTADAPIMLPAYVDFWAQTDPVPVPSPDVSLFLHGPDRHIPDVQVCWRSDLDSQDVTQNKWTEAVSMCPPTSFECLPVRIDVFSRWWRGDKKAQDTLSDVDGAAPYDEGREELSVADRRALRWRGPDSDHTELVHDVGEIRPGDVVVLPARLGGWNVLGHVPDVPEPDACPAGEPHAYVRIDAGDAANWLARRRAILRLHTGFLSGESARATLASFLQADEVPEDTTGLFDALAEVTVCDDTPKSVQDLVNELRKDRKCKIVPHPSGGLVLRGSSRRRDGHADMSFTHEDDSASATVRVTLADHLDHVREQAAGFARASGLPEDLASDIVLAASLHDLGKADPRFQALLHGASRLAAGLPDVLLAKSDRIPQSRWERRRARLAVKLPSPFPHSLLSVRLAESAAEALAKAHDADLVLHLIASHHGHCRPFAGVVPDDRAGPVCLELNGRRFEYTPNRDTVSGHGLERLDSGVPERFWRLVRRYGWWGLAYLEAVLILADHRASEAEEQTGQTEARASQPRLQPAQEDSK